MKRKRDYYSIGQSIELGLIPCRVCNERHVLVYKGLGFFSWASENGQGHTYQEKNEREYIQEQRDEINRLLKIIRQLRSKLYKKNK